MNQTIFSKYAAVLLPLAIIVLGAVQTALQDGLDTSEALQLGILVVSLAPTYFGRLADARWAGIIKTGSQIVGALLVTATPFIVQGHIEPDQLVLVVLAVLNALATEIGVEIRTANPELGTARVTGTRRV